ncbi:MAG: 30S ribosomal protein S6 [Pseudomonadota bacterium]
MPIYETVLIARQELTTKQVEDMTAQFSELLTKQGGKVLKTEQWGLRQLAYRINKNRKGHYVLIESDSPGAAVIEMERNMRLSEDVLRYMSIRLDAPTTAQSAILNKDTYEDRFERNNDSRMNEAA